MLQGKLVRLRSITREDLPRLWEFNNSLEVEIAGGGDPPTPQSLERLQAEFDQEASKGGRDGPSFAIEVDGKFIGQCALFNIDSVAQTCEIGITIGDKEYWGRGYGRDAMRLLLWYAFVQRNIHRVWLKVHAENKRAIRSYWSCGFKEEGRLRAHVWTNGHYEDLIVMGLLREEWVTLT
jgi:RimJ/RimL family protein N-acetyltransferase